MVDAVERHRRRHGRYPAGPGRIAGETLRQKVTAKTAKGSFVISASVSDARGRSHASAKAVFGG